jgi:transposase
MKTYSMDLRERVLADCDEGMSTSGVADKYRVSQSWVRRLKQRRRDDGTIGPRDHRTGPKPSWEAYADRLRQAIADDPDATLAELKARLALSVALSTLWRAVAALGLTVKKNGSRGGAGSPGRERETAGVEGHAANS